MVSENPVIAAQHTESRRNRHSYDRSLELSADSNDRQLSFESLRAVVASVSIFDNLDERLKHPIDDMARRRR